MGVMGVRRKIEKVVFLENSLTDIDDVRTEPSFINWNRTFRYNCCHLLAIYVSGDRTPRERSSILTQINVLVGCRTLTGQKYSLLEHYVCIESLIKKKYLALFITRIIQSVVNYHPCINKSKRL